MPLVGSVFLSSLSPLDFIRAGGPSQPVSVQLGLSRVDGSGGLDRMPMFGLDWTKSIAGTNPTKF